MILHYTTSKGENSSCPAPPTKPFTTEYVVRFNNTEIQFAGFQTGFRHGAVALFLKNLYKPSLSNPLSADRGKVIANPHSMTILTGDHQYPGEQASSTILNNTAPPPPRRFSPLASSGHTKHQVYECNCYLSFLHPKKSIC
jgi:hypothetical protein